MMAGVPWANQAGVTTFFTRMHVRYTLDKFPEDLFFQETPNKEMYQARYVITHPAGGDLSCKEGKVYKQKLRLRRKQELRNLANLSQWDTEEFYDYVANGTDKIKEKDNSDQNELIPVGGSSGKGGPSKVLFFSVFGLLVVYSLSRVRSLSLNKS
jgi:hypothetical protein